MNVEPAVEWNPNPRSWVRVAIAWTLVAIPLAWGIYRTIKMAIVLFR